MQQIEINSAEHRALISEALIKNEVHILKQLRRAANSGKPLIKVMEGFFEILMVSSYPDNYTDQEPEIILNKNFYEFLQKTKRAL